MPKNSPNTIIIHCSDISYKEVWDQLDSINKYHASIDFPKSSLGFFVGYHRLISGGQNYQCRLDTDEGAHTNQIVNGLSMNFQSLGICIGFDGDIETIPDDWRLMLQKQILLWQDKYSIPNENVKFHRDYNLQKTCPGSLVTRDWLNKLLERVPIPKPIDQCIKQQEIRNQLTIISKAIDLILKLLTQFGF